MWLFGTAVGLVLLMGATVAVSWEHREGHEGPPRWVGLALIVPSLTAILAGLGGGISAILALRRGDRSAVLMLPLAVTAIAVAFLAGEVLIPH